MPSKVASALGDAIGSALPHSLNLAWGRGGLILYRTKVPAGALNGKSVLDIGEPVRDYAKARRDLL